MRRRTVHQSGAACGTSFATCLLALPLGISRCDPAEGFSFPEREVGSRGLVLRDS